MGYIETVIKQYKAGILHSLVGLAACSKNVFQILHLVRYLIKNYYLLCFVNTFPFPLTMTPPPETLTFLQVHEGLSFVQL